MGGLPLMSSTFEVHGSAKNQPASHSTNPHPSPTHIHVPSVSYARTCSQTNNTQTQTHTLSLVLFDSQYNFSPSLARSLTRTHAYMHTCVTENTAKGERGEG